MTGADQCEEDNELNDIVDEFTNIVVGGAKKGFAEFFFIQYQYQSAYGGIRERQQNQT